MEHSRVASACRVVSASASTWIGIRDRVMDATTASLAIRLHWARDGCVRDSLYTITINEWLNPVIDPFRNFNYRAPNVSCLLDKMAFARETSARLALRQEIE